jgi:LysR family glycine cleavage system transcriptional activator
VKGLGIEDLTAGRLIEPFGPTRRSSRPFFLVYPPDRLRNRRLRAFKEWLSLESEAT